MSAPNSGVARSKPARKRPSRPTNGSGASGTTGTAGTATRTPIPGDPDLERFIQRARIYLYHKRCAREHFDDLLHEMVILWLLYDLEGKGPPHLYLLFLKAVDRLNPRHYTGDGTRLRENELVRPARPAALAELAAPPRPPAALDLPAKGSERAMRALRDVWGFTQQEIAWLWGVTPGRISHIIGGKAAW